MFNNLSKLFNRLKSNTSKFYLREDFSYDTGIPVDRDYSFGDGEGHEIMHISAAGVITVRKGFKWDGCSPKIRIGDLGYLGTPDGILYYHKDTGDWQPKCYYGTCIHDPCYKFYRTIPYTREQIDGFMLALFERAEFKHAKTYHWWVRKLGWLPWQ